VTLPPSLPSVTTGRHFARDVLIEWDLPALVDDAQLGTSELVTNAIRHAGTDVELILRFDDVITIEVQDRRPELHRPAPNEDVNAESGRGLHIVASISENWGVTARGNGKSVWFTLALPDVGAVDADIYAIGGPRGTDRHHPVSPSTGTGARQQARAGT